MNRERILEAEIEAKRFLGRITKLRKAYGNNFDREIEHTKESGSIKRASLDLTRALAEMRKTNG